MTELSPMEKLWAASAEVSGVEIFTPSAQAALNAYGSSPLPNDHVFDHRHCLAAALRAAALICTRERRTLMAIADELEGVKYGTYRSDLTDRPQ